MNSSTKTVAAKGFADQHPRYSALCTLPGGNVITTASARAQGFTVRGAEEAIAQPKALPRPLPAPLAAVPALPVVPPVSADVVADRARAAALIAMTAKGAEAETECREAIRSGASVEEYRSTVAARSILDAMAMRRR